MTSVASGKVVGMTTGVKATVALNSQVCDAHPQSVRQRLLRRCSVLWQESPTP